MKTLFLWVPACVLCLVTACDLGRQSTDVVPGGDDSDGVGGSLSTTQLAGNAEGYHGDDLGMLGGDLLCRATPEVSENWVWVSIRWNYDADPSKPSLMARLSYLSLIDGELRAVKVIMPFVVTRLDGADERIYSERRFRLRIQTSSPVQTNIKYDAIMTATIDGKVEVLSMGCLLYVL